MLKTATNIDKGPRPAPAKPYPAWPEMLARLKQERPEERERLAPPSRDWRDLVADMIVGRR